MLNSWACPYFEIGDICRFLVLSGNKFAYDPEQDKFSLQVRGPNGNLKYIPVLITEPWHQHLTRLALGVDLEHG